LEPDQEALITEILQFAFGIMNGQALDNSGTNDGHSLDKVWTKENSQRKKAADFKMLFILPMPVWVCFSIIFATGSACLSSMYESS